VNATQQTTLFLRAPAKINLGLEVLQRRHDGYHDIQSIFVALMFGDDLVIECKAGDIEFVCQPDVTVLPEQNFVYKAARALQKSVAPTGRGAKIRLVKHIPAGAGLGGGSSDAGAALLGLRECWQLSDTNLILEDIAASIGSDVPFFLDPGIRLVCGRGEKRYALPGEFPFEVVLIFTGLHIDTAWAYRELNRITPRPPSNIVHDLAQLVGGQEHNSNALLNDFEAPVFARYPLLEDIKCTLYRLGARFASMSGTGSALYGLFTPNTLPQDIESIFAPHHVVVTKALSNLTNKTP